MWQRLLSFLKKYRKIYFEMPNMFSNCKKKILKTIFDKKDYYSPPPSAVSLICFYIIATKKYKWIVLYSISQNDGIIAISPGIMIHEKMEVGRNTYLFIYNILFGVIGLFRQKKTSKCFQLIKAMGIPIS